MVPPAGTYGPWFGSTKGVTTEVRKRLQASTVRHCKKPTSDGSNSPDEEEPPRRVASPSSAPTAAPQKKRKATATESAPGSKKCKEVRLFWFVFLRLLVLPIVDNQINPSLSPGWQRRSRLQMAQVAWPLVPLGSQGRRWQACNLQAVLGDPRQTRGSSVAATPEPPHRLQARPR